MANPNCVNLGSVGLVFLSVDEDTVRNVTESDLRDVHQQLDL